ncbi:MAG: TIGR02466 family protein [Alphaproteobacteria bacterium]|nr:TIGR02466 family protein [Alphaproteobacteria bacterium]
MTQEVLRDGFVTLWPTIMVQRLLPGHEANNPMFIEHIEAMERQHEHGSKDLTTDFMSANYFELDLPHVGWLRNHINQTVQTYFREMGMNYEIRWVIQGWANINRLGDYHEPHNHPRSYLSGTYYVKMPRGTDTESNRSDVRPNCITFFDPRATANMTAIRDDPYVAYEHTVQPRPGLMMMWPSFVNHFVHPNLSKDTRISVSFNIVLHWSDSYLPDTA